MAYINAGKLYQYAVKLIDSVDAGGFGPALSSIVFASLSLETFINEIPFIAKLSIENDINNAPKLRIFSDEMAKLEQDHAPIHEKYYVGKLLISGEPFDKGGSPYQDFRDLVNLRNDIVHQKSFEEFKTDNAGNVLIEKRKLEPFRSRGLLAKYSVFDELRLDSDEVITNWLHDIGTKKMASFACHVASQMVNCFLDGIPQGIFRLKTESAYRDAFEPIAPMGRET